MKCEDYTCLGGFKDKEEHCESLVYKIKYDDDGEADCYSILSNTLVAEGYMNDFTDQFLLNQWVKLGGVDLFTDKIAIIGSTLKEHHDIFNTPFNSFDNSGEMFGVELHANTIQQILDNNHIHSYLKFEGYNTNVNDKIISLIIISLISFLVFFGS